MPPDIISLLKLLKDLLPPDVYARIIPNILGLMESTDPNMHRQLGQMLMEWIRANYPQYAKLMETILQRMAPAAAEAGGAGGAGGAAGGTGGAAAALTAAQVAAILAALVAILFAAWSIYSEANTGLYTPPIPPTGGTPCGTGTPGGMRMARLRRTVSCWGWGSRSTLNKAIRLAEDMCNADSQHCTGGCTGAGLSCKPDVAIQNVESFNGILATRVVLEFTCPCVCK